MSMELINQVSDRSGWTKIDTIDQLDDFINRSGEHALFLPGDPKRNLESNDVAVILPEIAIYFQHRFDVAIVSEAIEADVRERFKAFKTPNILFCRQGEFLGDIPKVRDWDDYVVRVTQILNKVVAPTH